MDREGLQTGQLYSEVAIGRGLAGDALADRCGDRPESREHSPGARVD